MLMYELLVLVYNTVRFDTLQSSAVITRSNLSRYYTWHCNDTNTTCIGFRTHNRGGGGGGGGGGGAYYENFEENWPRYNGTTLYYQQHDNGSGKSLFSLQTHNLRTKYWAKIVNALTRKNTVLHRFHTIHEGTEFMRWGNSLIPEFPFGTTTMLGYVWR